MGKIEKMNSLTDWERELALLENKSNLRKLPVIRHLGREVEVNGKVMLNLSSNDYLGLAAYLPLRTEFLQSLTPDTFLPSSSSSRLLTGNFNIYVQIEDLLARLFRKESALVFNSGYHMNAGILPAVSDARTLILADKLVHASIIDGIRLSAAKCIRYRHTDRTSSTDQEFSSNLFSSLNLSRSSKLIALSISNIPVLDLINPVIWAPTPSSCPRSWQILLT